MTTRDGEWKEESLAREAEGEALCQRQRQHQATLAAPPKLLVPRQSVPVGKVGNPRGYRSGPPVPHGPYHPTCTYSPYGYVFRTRA